jgi:prepilin-type N-terminal cleavage/methylation domain-containing protein
MMRRKESSRGFTLIELLVVVIILAILMLILVPIFQSAIQKTKQKTTMSDMSDLAKAVMSYITDVGSAPTSPNGELAPDSQLVMDLTPMQKITFSTRDNWGMPYRVWTGLDVAGVFGIDSAEVGTDDFIIQSLGRDGLDEGFSYNPNDSSNNFYVIQDISDFSRDLILWNGGWIHAPRASG